MFKLLKWLEVAECLYEKPHTSFMDVKNNILSLKLMIYNCTNYTNFPDWNIFFDPYFSLFDWILKFTVYT